MIASYLFAQVARAYLRVGDRGEPEFVLLEQPARPSFIDVLHPWFVQGHAGAFRSVCIVAGGLPFTPVGAQPELRRDSRDDRTPALECGRPAIPRRPVAGILQRPSSAMTRPGAAGRDQAVDGERAAVAARIDHVVIRASARPRGGRAPWSRLVSRDMTAAVECPLDRRARRRPSAAAASSRSRRTAVPAAGGRRAPRRIVLALEQRLHVRAVRLRKQDDVGPRRIRVCRPRGTVRATRCISMPLCSSSSSSLATACGSSCSGGMTNAKGPPRLALLDRASPHVVEVLDDPLAISGDRVQQARVPRSGRSRRCPEASRRRPATGREN